MKKGFTLIELLVVIAIIAILSSIVLASLKDSRDKAKDAAIKGEMVNLRSAAELFFSKNKSYGPALQSCSSSAPASIWNDPNIKSLITNLQKRTSTPLSCANTATTWEVNAQLVTDSSKYFCVDSNSRAVEAGVPDLNDAACGASLPGGGGGTLYSVTLGSGQATLLLDPTGPSFSAGTNVDVTIFPNEGYLIEGAGDNGVTIPSCEGAGIPVCSFTISNISANHTISVGTSYLATP